MSIEGFDVRRVIEQSSARTTVNDLAKRGIRSVRLIDESMIHRLINQAVEKIVISRAELLTHEEREKIYQAARKELGRLVQEQQQMAERVETATQDRDGLLKQLDNMREQLNIITRMSDEEARRRFNEGVATQAPLIQSQRDRITDLEKQLSEARTQNGSPKVEEMLGVMKEMFKAREQSLSREMEQRLAAQPKVEDLVGQLRDALETRLSAQPNVEELVGRLTAALSTRDAGEPKTDEIMGRLKEILGTRDAALAGEIERAFSKSMNTMGKKLESIRVKVAGGTDVEFRPGEATLASIINEKVESNLGVVGVKSASGSQVDDAVGRLRKMRAAPVKA